MRNDKRRLLVSDEGEKTMSTPVMSKGDRDQAILGSFALRELDDQLNDAIEDLERP